MISIGSTQSDLCPIRALQAYLAVSFAAWFWSLIRWWDGPLVTCGDVNMFQPTSHWIGGTFASFGISDSTIQVLGRWSSNDYCQYLCLSDVMLRDFNHLTVGVFLLTRASVPDNVDGHSISLYCRWLTPK